MSNSLPLSFTDYSFFLMDSKTRPLDFSIIFELKEAISLDDLQAGAELAFNSYPQSASIIKGKEWVPHKAEWKVEEIETNEPKKFIDDYISTPIDLTSERGVRQVLIKHESKNYLLTRFHHAVGDFISFLHWMNTQLIGYVHSEALHVKTFAGKRPIKTKYVYKKKALPFGNHKGKISNQRNWNRVILNKPQRNVRDLGISYNDLLSATIFKALREYNLTRGIKENRNALYLPMNLREKPFSGFGNASARIKVYDRFSDEDTYLDVAKKLREQVKHCRETGFWAIPLEIGKFGKFPHSIAKFLLGNLGIRLSEAGSLIFSHIDRADGFEKLYDKINDLIIISQLHHVYPLNLAAVGIKDKTHLTATWDEALVKESEAHKFLDLILSHQRKAYSELNL